MRKGFLGSIAALTAGAGVAWGQPQVDPVVPPAAPPTLPGVAAPGDPPPPPARVPMFGGFAPYATPGTAGFAPPPAILPPGNFGPPSDPLGLGPVGGFGPPPGPVFPVPGPYAQQSYQPGAPTPNVSDGTGGFGAAPHWWIDGEYLMWFSKGQRINSPLLTTSAPSDAGLPGAASTLVLVGGGRDLGYNLINGYRFSAGFFGDADRRFGFEMEGFWTSRNSNNQDFGSLSDSAGIPVLARPFVSTSGAVDTVVLSGPSLGPAAVRVTTSSQTWGVEPEGVWNIYRAEPGTRSIFSIDLIAGYRFIQLKENLDITSATMLNPGSVIPTFTLGSTGVTQTGLSLISPGQTTFGGVDVGGPALLTVRDSFTTTNQFNGFVLGLKGDAQYGIFTASSFAKIAVGDMHERVTIFGGSAFTSQPNLLGSLGSTTASTTFLGQNGGAYGGVLANASNIGTYIYDRFSYIPEVGTKIGISITRGLTCYIGGNFLYFPDVVRPGALVNSQVSNAAVPFSSSYGATGATRAPTPFAFTQESHWLGGLNIGLTLKY